MIEPLTSLAFSVYSGKGVYALLLGSGLSRAAQIPTGWEITLELVRKIAALQNESCEPKPEKWYFDKFGKEPDYSDLMEALSITPAERTNALAPYFEATPEEREAGKKIPTAGHRAIAQTIAKGYLRVIIATNFDRLMEQALEAEGVNPTVISTSDMVKGAIPLAHSGCTVIKVHGDYRDTRLRNTSKELSAYDADLDRLLDQVFDEYGLIVCGWSATWDEALRNAILRSPSRRYSATWASKGALSAEAETLAQFRRVSILSIESADQFFTSLAEKLVALERFNAPHPLSKALAVASLKRFLIEDRFRIQLNDLLSEETNRQIAALAPLDIPVQAPNCAWFIDRVSLYEASMETLIALVSNGAYWGDASQASFWCRAIVRVLGTGLPPSGNSVAVALRRYRPACSCTPPGLRPLPTESTGC